MKSLYIFFCSLSFLSLLSSCTQETEEITEMSDNCWQPTMSQNISFTQLSDLTVTPPSKIALLFKLDDIDGKPVANLTETNFNIYEQTGDISCLQPISTSEAPRSIRQQVENNFTYTTFIVLDLSGSVLANYSEELKEATKSLINEINSSTFSDLNSIGIYWFDGAADIHELIAPSFDKERVIGSIDSIQPSISNDNSTNLYGAVEDISQRANGILKNDENIAGVSVFLFTDGQDRANRTPRQVAYNAIDNSSDAISFFTVGLGEEINQEDLQKFGRDQFILLTEISELVNTFISIAQSVEDEYDSYYLLEYCSPIRSGADNTLYIEAIDGDNSGFFEGTFNAESFEGGCTL